jgi:ribA/ribD-fused uncharacterized protein
MTKPKVQIIDSFENTFLSNFAPINLKIKGKFWLTVEHLFQACKTMDSNEQETIRKAKTPAQAKKIGRTVNLRKDWNAVKSYKMLQCLNLKFKHCPDYRKALIATGDAQLIEGNYWHDNFWGDCRCRKCKNIYGNNQLGKHLMQIRSQLLSAKNL